MASNKVTKTEAALLARIEALGRGYCTVEFGHKGSRSWGGRERAAAARLAARGIVTLTSNGGSVVNVRRGRGAYVATYTIAIVGGTR